MRFVHLGLERGLLLWPEIALAVVNRVHTHTQDQSGDRDVDSPKTQTLLRKMLSKLSVSLLLA